MANAPAAVITRVASHGVSLARAPAAMVPIRPPGAEPAGGAASRSLASCFCKEPASAATDRGPDPPNPKKRTTVPSAPVLWYIHAMASGAASMNSARPAVTAAAQPTALARCSPRPGPPDTSVAHQYKKTISVVPAATAGGSHHVSAMTDADAWPCDHVSTPCWCSSQPQAWLKAYSGARTSTQVTAAPNSSERTATSTVFASGAM